MELPENITEIELNEKTLWRPPAELFIHRNRMTNVERVASEEPRMIFKELVYTPEGRVMMQFLDFKHPRKSILDPFLMDDLNMAKRASMGYMSVFKPKAKEPPKGEWAKAVEKLRKWYGYLILLPAGLTIVLMPWQDKVDKIEGFLDGWCREMEWQMEKWYMEPRRYMLITQEIGWFVQNLMSMLGFSEDLYLRTTRAVMALVEYDSQYNMPLKDVFYQLEDKTGLLRRPGREIERLAGILEARDKVRTGKFRQFARLGRLVLLVPRIRRAFRACVEEMTLENLWPDADDFYWMCRQTDYDYDGKPFEERWKIFEKEHTDPETGKVSLPRMMIFVPQGGKNPSK